MPRRYKPSGHPGGKVVPHNLRPLAKALDRLRPPPLPDFADIDIKPLLPPGWLRLAPTAPVPEIEPNRAAFEYLISELRLKGRHYKYKAAWEDCRDKFKTPNSDFRIIWPRARVAAGLPERARRRRPPPGTNR